MKFFFCIRTIRLTTVTLKIQLKFCGTSGSQALMHLSTRTFCTSMCKVMCILWQLLRKRLFTSKTIARGKIRLPLYSCMPFLLKPNCTRAISGNQPQDVIISHKPHLIHLWKSMKCLLCTASLFKEFTEISYKIYPPLNAT